MEKERNELKEQQSPEKNTDNAFVKVSEDGSPQMPQEGEASDADKLLRDEDGSTIKHR